MRGQEVSVDMYYSSSANVTLKLPGPHPDVAIKLHVFSVTHYGVWLNFN